VFTPKDARVDEDFDEITDTSDGRLNAFFVLDDMSAFDHTIKTLKERGAAIVELPTMSDIETLLPFLIKNDNGILIVKNPPKSMHSILKQLLKTSSIRYKNQKLTFSITIWMVLDSGFYLETKLKQT